MEVESGQVWTRIPPSDFKFFPKKSWKVIVIGVVDGVIFHRMCEYNGDRRSGGQVFEMDEDLFLENYELYK